MSKSQIKVEFEGLLREMFPNIPRLEDKYHEILRHGLENSIIQNTEDEDSPNHQWYEYLNTTHNLSDKLICHILSGDGNFDTPIHSYPRLQEVLFGPSIGSYDPRGRINERYYNSYIYKLLTQ